MIEQENKKLNSESADTIVDGVLKEITVKSWEYGFFDKLFKRPNKRTFKLYRSRVCNMYRCAEAANKIPDINANIHTMEQLTNVALPLIYNHKDDIIYLIASCIQNNSKEPKKSLIRFINNNMSGEQIFDVLNTCLHVIGLESFLMATALIKGTNVLTAKDTDVSAAKVQD